MMTNNTQWSIDQSQSEITFKIGHIIISHVKGFIKKFDASIYTNFKDFTSAEVDLWMDPSSITTGDQNRDKQIKGEDFFDVNKYPQITFKSNTLDQPDKEGNHELRGDLTIKDITKRVKFHAKFDEIKTSKENQDQVTMKLAGKLNRSDWGLYGKSSFEFGGMMVSKDVKILCHIRLVNVGHKNPTMVLESRTREGSEL